ncbi:P-loop NTPase fold protein [Bifidobacterium mongoliense]|uniref:KAP family P-loop NTPase fold protein n=1 Tax=Bifidobacterium mongoliense TaxID=518643 RepID=UPI0030EF41EB
MGDTAQDGSGFSREHPIEHAKDDEFNRQAYVSELLNALWRSDDINGLVVGISGPWGSGKTSLKTMLVEEINAARKTSQSFHVVEFEPWMYSGSGKLVSLLFNEVADDLSPKRGRLRRFKVRAVHLVIRVSPFLSDAASAANVVIPGVGAVSSSLIKAFSGLAKATDPTNDDIDSLAWRREKLKRKLDKSPDRIIVFIDDLDRLMDDEVVEMLRAVKAVGDLPHMTYVLLYDRDSITRSLDATCHGKGDEYLEKIVQVPLDLPEPPQDIVSERLKAEVVAAAGLASKKIYEPGIERLFEPNSYDNCVKPYVRTMRDAIRLSNEFKLRYMVMKDDVEADDLLSITSLEVFRPSLHRWIMGHKALLCSPVTGRTSYPGQHNGEEQRAQSLAAELEGLREAPDREALKSLFPFIKAALARNWSIANTREDDPRRSICRTEHFDAYFRLSTDRDVLHEAEFKQFVLVDDLLDPGFPRDDQLKIFGDKYFPGKASSYLNGSDTERIQKVILGCLKCDQMISEVLRGCISINVATAILNRNNGSRLHTDVLTTIVGAIAQSDSIAAVPTALALAVQMQKELHDSGTAEAPVLLPQGYDLLRIPMHREDLQPWEESLTALKQKVLSPFSPRRAERPMLFGTDLLEFCTHAVLYLYDHNAERRSAFESLRPLVDPNQYPLFVVDALAGKTDTGYVLNGPLLSELVTREQYQSAIDTLIDQGTLWEYAPSDRQAVAAYQVALDGSSSPSSSPSQLPASPESSEFSAPIPEAQTKLVVDGWEKRVNEVVRAMSKNDE